MAKMREHSNVIVDQAEMISTELIRAAILWHEMWYDGLEEASKYYFADQNIPGMFQVLEPLHEMVERVSTRDFCHIATLTTCRDQRHCERLHSSRVSVTTSGLHGNILPSTPCTETIPRSNKHGISTTL
jgi:hypothetical protein